MSNNNEESQHESGRAVNGRTAVQEAQSGGIDLQELLIMFLNKWYWFVISIAVCVGFMYYHVRCIVPTYTRTATVLLKVSSGEETGINELGAFKNSYNMLHEIAMMKSPDQLVEVVRRLNLDVNYHTDGRLRIVPLYGVQLPAEVRFLDPLSPNAGGASLDLRVDNVKEGTLTLSDFALGGQQFDKVIKCRLGDTIDTPVGKIAIVNGRDKTSLGAFGEVIHVQRTGLKSAAGAIAGVLDIRQENDQSRILRLTCNDACPERASDILNTVIAVYNENWVNDKNQIAVSTSMFISDRLAVIESELGNVDSDISNFKSANLMPDVGAVASAAMQDATQARSAIRSLSQQLYMLRFVRNFVTNGANQFEPLPVNSDMSSLNLAPQIAEYNKMVIERNELVNHSSTAHPLIAEMENKIAALRQVVISSIDNQIIIVNEQMKVQQGFSGSATAQIAAAPTKSKDLLSNERQQKVKESLYLYLLQKREENELSQAFTAYNTRIITTPAGSGLPTYPQTKESLLLALAVGFAIPALIIFLRTQFNTTVRGRKDLEVLSLPFAGEIPQIPEKWQNKWERRLDKVAFWKKKRGRSKKDYNVVVKKGSRDIINEAFRVVRTNVAFMTNKTPQDNVIALTSFNPGSGKSFISMNLAVSFAIKGKKVLVIDGDLRHGSLSQYVGNVKGYGLADYLSGFTDDPSEIMVSYGPHPNLKVVPVGKIPPNPTELLEDDRFANLIKGLKGDFDYVFIDCPPIDIVADTQIIAQVVNRTAFIVRAGLLERSMLGELEQMFLEHRFPAMTVMLNGTDGGTTRYGSRYGYRYGYKYGYAYGYGSSSYYAKS